MFCCLGLLATYAFVIFRFPSFTANGLVFWCSLQSVAGYQPAREVVLVNFRYRVLLSFRESVYYDHQKHVTLILAYTLRQLSLLGGFPPSSFNFGFRLICRKRFLPEQASLFFGRVLRYCPGMLTGQSAPGYNVYIFSHNIQFLCCKDIVWKDFSTIVSLN